MTSRRRRRLQTERGRNTDIIIIQIKSELLIGFSIKASADEKTKLSRQSISLMKSGSVLRSRRRCHGDVVTSDTHRPVDNRKQRSCLPVCRFLK